MSDARSEAYVYDDEDEDYEVIRVSISWGLVSILFFAAILTIQLFGFRVFGLRLFQVVSATLPLSLIGFALGLIGLKIGRARRSAKIGVFLNGVVLFCIFVLVPLTVFAWRWLR